MVQLVSQHSDKRQQTIVPSATSYSCLGRASTGIRHFGRPQTFVFTQMIRFWNQGPEWLNKTLVSLLMWGVSLQWRCSSICLYYKKNVAPSSGFCSDLWQWHSATIWPRMLTTGFSVVLTVFVSNLSFNKEKTRGSIWHWPLKMSSFFYSHCFYWENNMSFQYAARHFPLKLQLGCEKWYWTQTEAAILDFKVRVGEKLIGHSQLDFLLSGPFSKFLQY